MLALLFGVLAMFGSKPASAADPITDPGAASGDGVQPVLIQNNPSCSSLGNYRELKFEPVKNESKTSTDGYLTATISNVRDEGSGQVFNWSTTRSIDRVIVKGGDASDAYVYNPEDTADTALHAPVNPNNGDYFGLSHVSFCYDIEPQVSKTANTTFTRTHNWEIEKSANPGSLDLFTGDSGTSKYAVSVANTGHTDSNWVVTGKITVTNPLRAEPLAITGVEDVITQAGSPGTTATVTNCTSSNVSIPLPSSPFVLAPGGSLECSYSADLPSGVDGTNKATAKATGFGIADGVGTANVTFGNPSTEKNKSITVDDTYSGGPQDETVSVGDAPKTFEYTRTFSCDADEGTHPNTATIEETGQSAEASVMVNCYDLGVSKTADTSFTRTHNWTIDKSVDQDKLDLFRGDSATVNYSIKVGSTSEDSDHAVSGTITVSNDTPIDANLANVSDVVSGDSPIEGSVECADANGAVSFPYTLKAGESLECSYNASLGDKSDRTNTATATLQNNTGGTTGFEGTAEVSFANAAVNQVNDTINVNDTFSGSGAPWTFDANDPSETFNRTYGRTFGCDADEGTHLNTATIIGDDGKQLGSDDASVVVNCYDLGVTKTADTSFTRTFDWTIDKSVDKDTLNLFEGDSGKVNYSVEVAATSEDSDHAVSGRIIVRNPAPIGANLASVSDQITGVSGPVEVDCGVDFPYTLAAGESLECSYSSGLDDKATRTNTATATLQNNTGDTTPFSGEATVSFANANMTQIKDKINVNDTFAGSGAPWTFDANDASETFNRTYERAFNCDADEGTHPNTATIEETGQSAEASVMVNCYDLGVSKTADTSFTRTHNWTIDKSVDQDKLDLFRGDSATVNYTVEATKTSADNDYAVSGKITVTNPAPMPANLASVTDDFGGKQANVSCDQLVVPANGELVCGYVIRFESKPADGTNTATATLANGTYYSGEAPVEFGDPTKVVNGTVHVDDTFAGSGSPWTFTDSGKVSYQRTFRCDADEGLHENRASIREIAGRTDDASVTVNCHDLTVDKSAETSLVRTYTWSIDKTADQSNLTLSIGQKYLVNYLVKVNAASADSGYKVSGKITVSNPAPIDASLASVTDAVSGGIAADVKCPDQLTVPAGGTLTCTYEARLPDDADRDNTATATLRNTSGGTTDFSSAPVPVRFANAAVDTVDESITVSDSLQGDLGTVTVGTDPLPKEFSYSRFVGPYSASGNYNVDNVASFVTNDTKTSGSDNWTVVIRVPASGAGCTLTIGYWKTHAGFTGNNPDMVSRYLPTWLGTAGNKTKSVKVTTATQAVSILDKADASNGINKLYAQLLAAKLNIANGADGSAVASTISEADAFLAKYNAAGWSTLSKAEQQKVINWASTLDNFNNGLIGPGHCSEEPTASI